MAAPLQLNGATMYSFCVGADLAALTKVVDEQLNVVAGAGTYKVLVPMVAIVCADIADSFSTVPPDSEKGWMAERDFGLWIPVVRGTTIGWYLPYVFVDNVAAMVTGREVFGFFKQTATLAMPPSPKEPGVFSVDALAIQTFSPESEAQVMRLMTMTSAESGPPPQGSWAGDVKKAFEDVFSAVKAMIGDVKGMPISTWELLKDGLKEAITGNVPMVFLKQFRDATDPTKACYQAVIEAPAHLAKLHDGWFAHPHDITIVPADSHPIAAECGLASGTLRSGLAFWCKMDFVMEAGVVVAGG